MTSNRRYWIGVACAEHVRRGRAGGFMQLCHGKAAPLRRLKEGDLIAYYSPVVKFGGKDRLQAFTAIGKVWDPEPYQADRGDGVCAFRRDVAWFESEEAAIAPLLEGLSFTKGVKNWGYAFRYGLLEITERDMDLILHAMRADVLAGA